MVKLGIYSCALLMMGAIAVASNLTNIMAAFPDVDPTTIVSYMISIPCLIVIPVTIITGKLMEKMAKKTLMIIGVLCWLIGGIMPFFLTSLGAILVMRCIIGVGVGMVQTLCAALVVENFEDEAERNQTMGNVAAFQMVGCVIFSLVAGNLGSISWNMAFLVHLIAVVSLLGAIFLLPYKKPEVNNSEKAKFTPTKSMWVWCMAFFIFMIGGQTYANSASSIITEMGLGDSAAAGYSLAIFAMGGAAMGFVFGKFAAFFKSMTLSAGCVMGAVAYIIMIFAPNLALSYIGAFIFGLALSVCIPCIMNGAAASVSGESSGMAVSLATCLQNVGMALSPYIVTALGASVAKSGTYTVNQGAMLSGMVIMLIVAVVFAIMNRKQK